AGDGAPERDRLHSEGAGQQRPGGGRVDGDARRCGSQTAGRDQRRLGSVDGELDGDDHRVADDGGGGRAAGNAEEREAGGDAVGQGRWVRVPRDGTGRPQAGERERESANETDGGRVAEREGLNRG